MSKNKDDMQRFYNFLENNKSQNNIAENQNSADKMFAMLVAENKKGKSSKKNRMPSDGKLLIAKILAVAVAVFVLIKMFFIFIGFMHVMTSDITKSTIKREKLQSSLNVTENENFFTDKPECLKHELLLKSAMKKFYDKTGVIPYLYITDKKEFSDDDLSFGENLYDELFNDQTHVLVIIQSDSENDPVCIVGNYAEKTIDKEAQNILKDYAKAYNTSNYEKSIAFSRCFEYSADRIMGNTPMYVIYLYIAGAVAVIAVILLIVNLTKKSQKNKGNTVYVSYDDNNNPILNSSIDKKK